MNDEKQISQVFKQGNSLAITLSAPLCKKRKIKAGSRISVSWTVI